MKLLSKAIVGAALATSALSKNVTYYWNLTYAQANPDGLQPRRVITVNGQWPPPVLHATLNDTLTIELQNSLDVSTTLHAHGLHLQNANYMDGAYMVTQCGIPPGANFTYTYDIQQTGTFWVHLHKGMQYADGLRAPLILHDPNETQAYDEDMVLPLEDWYHRESAELTHEFLSWKNPGGAEPVPNSMLVNRTGAEPTTLRFEPGKTYRIRLINMSVLATFHFAIEGHTMRVIEVDGVDCQPHKVTNVQVAAAQRVSVLVTALNSTANNYVFHADMDTDMFDSVPDTLVYNTTGTIEYSPDASLKRSTAEWTPFADFDLVPLDEHEALDFDVTYNLDVIFGQFTDALNHGTFNNISYTEPNLPAMLTALTAHDPFDPRAYGSHTNTRVIEHMKDVQLVISNLDAGMHPIHLHMADMQLIARGATPYDATFNPRPTRAPMRRDTVAIPSMEYVVLRFRAKRAGVLLAHCHLQWHHVSGLAMQFVVAPDVMRKSLNVPEVVYDQCRQMGLPVAGNALDQPGPLVYPAGWTRKAKGAMAGCIVSALVGFAAIVWYGWSSQRTYKTVPNDEPEAS
ncbi:ferroxidase fet3 [Coemansia sp. RSA 2711]|nr:ferroxidase fet3 [Coemansia sp. RSA 2711]